MSGSPSKEQVLIQELLQKLDAERAKSARLESELSQYKEPARMKKELESKIKEQEAIIKKKDQTIDKLSQEMAWLRRKFWGKSTERYIQENDMRDDILMWSAQQNQNPKYAYTMDNLLKCWGILILFSFGYAAIAVLFLEMIDRDKR